MTDFDLIGNVENCVFDFTARVENGNDPHEMLQHLIDELNQVIKGVKIYETNAKGEWDLIK